MAFKGGNIEKNVLWRLNIPYLDLEEYGCPKFDELKKSLTSFKTCGFHIDETLHCPQAEVTAFRAWMLENISEPRQSRKFRIKTTKEIEK
ncbi:hypothetical protein JTE90_009834 [Oedothorax gibbosus]|nr:hypothetical protein JTE90_009833 [Oedothorax gibbosus]KAG8172489.1 hypothetical protein JTE90_009834 [Oedothorax gibbosus]